MFITDLRYNRSLCTMSTKLTEGIGQLSSRDCLRRNVTRRGVKIDDRRLLLMFFRLHLSNKVQYQISYKRNLPRPLGRECPYNKRHLSKCSKMKTNRPYLPVCYNLIIDCSIYNTRTFNLPKSTYFHWPTTLKGVR